MKLNDFHFFKSLLKNALKIGNRPASLTCDPSNFNSTDDKLLFNETALTIPPVCSELKPIKHLGIVYTSGETNAVAVLEKMTALAKEKGIEVISAGVTNSSEVRVAAESIIDRVDAMYVSTDNVVISAIASLSDVCFNHKVPLFSADTTSSYDTDVLIAGGFDYYKSGILTGELIEKVLDGTKPEDIGVQYLSTEDLEIYVNLDVAEAIGIEIPENVLSNASIIIKDGSVL